jgi:N6-L-threonylcarbamoyladenine synthase
MRILAIETSCDDTCIAIVEASPRRGSKIPHFRVLANVISSQTEIHKKYGGVVPSLAKRAHQENLVTVLEKALGEAGMKLSPSAKSYTKGQSKIKNAGKILEREPELLEQFIKTVVPIPKPKINFIAVTHGPGLEPALWAGINFARALSYWWRIPLLGVDHMEGHIAANFLHTGKVEFPAIVLAVSGGHTQLILVKDILKYKLIGETVDDAAGEGFDKVARMLGLSFPGGPEIAKSAKGGNPKAFDFPRPMLHSKDYNFSFSGLKTAVLYTIRDLTVTSKIKKDIAASFQQAAVDVLIAKTIRAAKQYKVKTIMLAGGVAANEELRKQFGEVIKKELPDTIYKIPHTSLATDNAAMIAAAAYFRRNKATLTRWKTLKANGNLKIG